MWQSSSALDKDGEGGELWHSIQEEVSGSFAHGANGEGDVNIIEGLGVEEEEEEEDEPRDEQKEEEEEFDDFAAVDPVEAVVSQLHDLQFMLHDKIQGPQ